MRFQIVSTPKGVVLSKEDSTACCMSVSLFRSLSLEEVLYELIPFLVPGKTVGLHTPEYEKQRLRNVSAHDSVLRRLVDVLDSYDGDPYYSEELYKARDIALAALSEAVVK